MKNDEWQHKGVVIILGDCVEVMAEMDAESVDAIVTDPPYALVGASRNGSSQPGDMSTPYGRSGPSKARRGFMGKEWDGQIPGIEVWSEALRVLKPGGHLLAFGGTRTSHRLVCALEDAGFEIRDTISYLHDDSQPMGAFFASLDDEQKRAYLDLHHPNGNCGWLYGSGFPKSLDVSKQLDKMAGAEREVVGSHSKAGDIKGGRLHAGSNEIGVVTEILHTAPATEAAKQWAGWGTALKPSFEPIILCRKPLSEPTVAANVLRWGTGALNIDACRIEGSERPLREQHRLKDEAGDIWKRNGEGYKDGSCSRHHNQRPIPGKSYP